jgi:antibiotic biosynthesis monooxygenase (ABM) superfamily enzyme
MNELRNMLGNGGDNAIQDVESESSELTNNVTEVFVTQVSPDKEDAYREWIAKIHQVESKFPGFRGMYVQAPNKNQGRNWITFLQFDTQKNLDRWLSSSERQQVLSEAQPLITVLESHRVITPYAGWFASLTEKGEIPSVWKQTMLVLLVLFPIVMLELKYLSLLTSNLNSSLATFIGNAISVTLIAWPMMPMTIDLLGWWLSPKNEKNSKITILGTCLLVLLYIIEIAVFWNFL